MREGCAFSARVRAAAEELGIELQLKDIDDEQLAEELAARGGKRQTPYLADDATGVEMYESDDIIAYMTQRAGA